MHCAQVMPLLLITLRIFKCITFRKLEPLPSSGVSGAKYTLQLSLVAQFLLGVQQSRILCSPTYDDGSVCSFRNVVCFRYIYKTTDMSRDSVIGIATGFFFIFFKFA
jgi:hypothetical protein